MLKYPTGDWRTLARLGAGLLLIALLPSAAFAGSGKRSLTLEVEAVKDATAYEFEVSAQTTGKTFLFKNRKPVFIGNLRPGKYSLRVRSYDDRGVAGSWGEPSAFEIKLPSVAQSSPAANAVIEDPTAKEIEVEFTWQAVDGAATYVVQIQPGGMERKTSETRTRMALANGAVYRWSVTAHTDSGQESEAPENIPQFTLRGPRLEAPSLVTPEDEFLRQLSWTKPEGADTVDVVLSRKAGQKWERVEAHEGLTEDKIPFADQLPGGRYRLTVKPRSTTGAHQDGPIAKMDFDAAPERTSEAAQRKALRNSVVPMKARAFAAGVNQEVLNYNFSNASANANTSFAGQAVTAWFSVRFQPQALAPWSVGAQFNLRLVKVGQQVYRSPSASVAASWTSHLGLSTVRLSAGLDHLKSLAVTEANGITSVQHVGATSPSLSASFRYPLWSRIYLGGAMDYTSSVLLLLTRSEGVKSVDASNFSAHAGYFNKSLGLQLIAGRYQETWRYSAYRGYSGGSQARSAADHFGGALEISF